MAGLTIKQASQETGKDRTTLLRAIQKGTITAKKDQNNAWVIEPSELFRIYARTKQSHRANAHDATSVHAVNIQDTPAHIGYKTPDITQTFIELAEARTAREFLERQLKEQMERIALLQETVKDLRQDKEAYRNQIKAITDQREHQPKVDPEPEAKPQEPVKKKFLGIF